MIRQNIRIVTFLALLLAATVSGSARAGVATGFDMPDTGYISNVVIDIAKHNGGVWFATSEGLNFSYDNGETWLSYDSDNGLVTSSVSALLSIPGSNGNRIWVATGHEEEFDGELFSFSDGVSYSDNDGNDWTQIVFDSTGLNIPFVWGIDRTIFDITGHYDENDPEDDWLFFTAFAGGLLASRDEGMTWRRIFPSADDSIQFFDSLVPPSLRNRYFSCVADTSHGDSLFLWAGTAAGFFQFVFAEPRDKAYSQHVNDIVFCETCPDEDSNFVYFGGDAGLTRGVKIGGAFITRFEEDGLPGPVVTAIADFGGTIFAGTMDPIDSSSTGLAESINFGESFTTSASFTETGAGKRILDFAKISDRLYMAAEEAGLFVTDDLGVTWTRIPVDTLVPSITSRRNAVHALNAWGDTLRVGTDSGLVNLFLSPTGAVDSARYHVFVEDDSSAAKVVAIETQTFGGTDVIWTANRPLTVDGTPMVARSSDGGVTFVPMQITVNSNDFAFFGDTVFVVGEEGIRYGDNEFNPINILEIYEYSGAEAVDSLVDDTITVMEVIGDTVYIGTRNGYAVSLTRGETYDIRRPNRDSLRHDVVVQYTSGIDGVLGNFIPALDVQYYPDTNARVWVSNRPALEGTVGISVGRTDIAVREEVDTNGIVIDIDTIIIYNWDSVYNNFAWNFAFNGDTVFAATDDGLLWARTSELLGGTLGWNTLELVDSLGFPLVFEGTSIFAAEVIGDYLWVGTGDRTVRIRLNDFNDQTPYFVVDETDEVYAFPIPFSHTIDQAVEFHFVLEEDANVTLEIYDFSMRLVKRVLDNEFFAAGIYPTAGGTRRVWDGKNGNGDDVAVGVYYFKFEYSSGEVRWGKLAVIP